MQVKPHSQNAAFGSFWPEGDEQARVVSDKSSTVPHFLCRAQQGGEPGKPGSKPNTIKQEDLVTDDSEHNVPPMAAAHRAKKFTPLSPHLHKMMTRRVEPPTHHQPPSWLQDPYPTNRTRIARGLAIASCLVVACGVGVGVTLMEFKGSESNLPNAWTSSLATIWPSFDAPREQMPKLPVIGAPSTDTASRALKPVPQSPVKIASVKLAVEDASGSAQLPIRLPVMADAGSSEQPIAVRLTGLPNDARLSAGAKQLDAAWLVKPAELENLHMTVSVAPTSPLKITVAAIETGSGELAAPMQEMTVTVDPQSVIIEPAALPASNSPNLSRDAKSNAISAPSKAAVAMRTRGDETLALGDVTGARGFYEMALEMGDTTSAARIGRTYDPVVFQAVGVHGLKPDPRLAAHWYKRAIKDGDAGAREDLDRLNKRQTP